MTLNTLADLFGPHMAIMAVFGAGLCCGLFGLWGYRWLRRTGRNLTIEWQLRRDVNLQAKKLTAPWDSRYRQPDFSPTGGDEKRNTGTRYRDSRGRMIWH